MSKTKTGTLEDQLFTMDANNTHRFKIKYYKNREKSWTKTKDLAAQLIPGAGTGIKETQDARNLVENYKKDPFAGIEEQKEQKNKAMAHKVKIRYVNYHGSLCQRTLNPHDIQAIEELTGNPGKHAELNHSKNRLADELINFYLHKGLNIIENPINTIIINNSIQGKVATSPSQSNSTNNEANELYETKIFDHQRMYVTPIFEKLSVSPISLEEDNSIETISNILSEESERSRLFTDTHPSWNIHPQNKGLINQKFTINTDYLKNHQDYEKFGKSTGHGASNYDGTSEHLGNPGVAILNEDGYLENIFTFEYGYTNSNKTVDDTQPILKGDNVSQKRERFVNSLTLLELIYLDKLAHGEEDDIFIYFITACRTAGVQNDENETSYLPPVHVSLLKTLSTEIPVSVKSVQEQNIFKNVKLKNLKTTTSNGKIGKIIGWIAEKGRYKIFFLDGSGKTKNYLPKNVEVLIETKDGGRKHRYNKTRRKSQTKLQKRQKNSIKRIYSNKKPRKTKNKTRKRKYIKSRKRQKTKNKRQKTK